MSEAKIQCPKCLASYRTEAEYTQHQESYHGWYPGKATGHDSASADALLTANAELRAALTQANNATEAERRARLMASADSGALYLALERLLFFVTSGKYLPDDDRALIERVYAAEHPGAALLAELDAARAVVAAARAACERTLFDGRGPLVTEIARYDWAVRDATKARA